MIRGLYISGTSMITNSKKMDAISNNIANIETAGFKRDDVTTESFNAVLMGKFNGSKYSIEGLPQGVNVEEGRDGYEGSTDIGYFRVSTDTGVSHNKEVRFSVDEEGYLSTYYLNSDRSKNWNLGDRLLGASGNFIQVGAEGNFNITETGEVTVGGETIDRLVSGTDRRVIGTLSAGVKLERIFTDFTQGQLRRTEKPLDFALEGDGFFVVNTPFGEVLTRDGHFKTDASRRLLTTEGYPVQGFNGDIIIEDTDIATNEFGEIIYGNEIIDKFQLVDVTNKGDLVKMGGGYYRMKEEPVGEMKDFEGTIHQYFVEQSNADSITEMINMMTLQRNYEASQRVITTHDSILDKAVNSIGQVR